MTLSFLIKKKYLAQKVAEQQATGVFFERRAYTKFWRARIGSASAWRLKIEDALLPMQQLFT